MHAAARQGHLAKEFALATYLDRILLAHRAAVALDNRDVDVLFARAAAAAPIRGFASALRRGDGLAVIAEVKRRSPSKGDLQPDLDPVELAIRYEAGGASCVSVLTDLEFFGGSSDDLQAARAAVALPVLRKDFTVCVNDVLDARIMGADCVLLIAAALSDAELAGYAEVAREIGIDALFEIHDEHELDRVLRCDAVLVGVNQRDLVTFEVDHARAERMAGRIPDSCVKVAESGVRDAADAKRLHDAGYDAVLVGETLVRSADPALTVKQLRGVVS